MSQSGPPDDATWVHEGTVRAIESNWLFQLRLERFRSRLTGRRHDYYLIDLADAVSVVALTPDQRVVLVRQFRAGSGRDGLETPGGLLGPGEAPEAAGARELLEETGYAGRFAGVVGTVWSNPALTTSRTTTLVIADARPVAPPRPDPEEELGLVLVDAAELPRLIERGAIDNALVVAGLLAWLAWGRGEIMG